MDEMCLICSRQSPFVYAVFPAISAGNACNAAENGSLTSVTMAFYPWDLSTIEGNSGATKLFNFADLPCPPASDASANRSLHNPAVNPGQAYQPLLAPPQALYSLDPTWIHCVTALPGFDPPSALPTAIIQSGVNNFPGPFFPPRHVQEDVTAVAKPAHKVRYIPLQTDAS